MKWFVCRYGFRRCVFCGGSRRGRECYIACVWIIWDPLQIRACAFCFGKAVFRKAYVEKILFENCSAGAESVEQQVNVFLHYVRMLLALPPAIKIGGCKKDDTKTSECFRTSN
jgi:hypothetical protein